ncbi:hypothetical protein BKA61DRAFT_620792 [Leptodontidium sp. MPI-SDFR-AT-0119]|nr:hypothetical protein BKA61DRAFT_620792 [Leptodontidium sp. MPI-SDFR-AT-0119]
MEDLIEIYFDKLHYASPMLHRSRYTAAVHLPYPVRPPMCLQYIVMALGAAATETYRQLATPFYRRARAYAESDEMAVSYARTPRNLKLRLKIKEQGEQFTTVAHAQCWILMANFEAQQTLFSRASTSLCRSLRIAQMLELHRIDQNDQSDQTLSSILAPPKEWSELEERRRTWWVIFCSDRFVSGTTGWPALINARDITTVLPASNEAFQTGIMEQTGSLMSILTQQRLDYSEFAARILAAHLFHRTFEHISQSSLDDNPQDVKNGSYWKAHRGLDNDLAAMLMFLPNNIRLPRSFRCQNALFVNVNIHTAIICLHRAALLKIRHLNLSDNLILQSQLRLLPAAEGILGIFRMIIDLETALKNPMMAFSAYMAALVFLEDYTTDYNHQSENNLQFLLRLLVTLGKTNVVTRSLAIQLASDMKHGGFDSSVMDQARRQEIFPLTYQDVLTNI